MNNDKTKLRRVLIERYTETLDELPGVNDEIGDFAELEEAVTHLAEKTLPETLSQLQQGRAFPPQSEVRCPACGGRTRSKGYGQRRVVSRWGKAWVKVKRWCCIEVRSARSQPSSRARRQRSKSGGARKHDLSE